VDELPLIDLLHQRAGPELTHAYLDALTVHYWLWHWLALSDPGTLATLRRILFDAGLVEANPDGTWVVNRGRREYDAMLSGVSERLERLPLETLDGHRDPAERYSWIDSGAGNGTALYELTSPWVQGHGWGLSLLFSIDGTLRNWLQEPHRGESVPAYRSDLLRSTLLQAEIFSAATFAAGRANRPDYDPFPLLGSARDAEGSYEARSLAIIRAETGAALDALGPHAGDDAAAAVGLGFVVDALAGRSVQPNAPGFHYERWELGPAARDAVVETLSQHSPLVVAGPGRLRAEHEAIIDLAQRHVSERSLSPDEDQVWSSRIATHADALKALAFAIRRATGDEHAPGLLHEVGNALWSWHFFLGDRQRWTDVPATGQLAADAVAQVRSWLERPWGLVGRTDITICLGGTPSDADLPPLAGPIVPLFRGGYDALRRSLRNPEVATEEALLELVQRRCRLRDLRNPRGQVLHPRTPEMALAELLVELVTLWFDELPAARRSTITSAALTPLRDALRTGVWWPELERSPGLPRLSRRQQVLLDTYLAAPSGVADSLFDFSTDDELIGRLDVYPPESFGVISN
jgi:hypothetical protein